MTIRPLTPTDLPQLLALQEVIFATLKDETLLRRNSVEMLSECLSMPHTALSAWEETELVAVAILYRPHEETEDLSHLLQGVKTCAMAESANYKLCLVHPNHRGQQLQQQLGRLLEITAQQQGVHRLCVTVAPHNIASRTNIQQQGFSYNRTLQKYGYLRELWYKEL